MASENDNPPSGQEYPSQQSKTAPIQIPPTLTELQSPRAKPDSKGSRKEEKHWLDYVTFALELIGLIVLCIYAGYTIKIYCANQQAADAAHDTLIEIQKQTKLARQQLVGTQAAIVRDDQPNWDISKGRFAALLLNDGAVTATHVELKAEVFKQSIPDGKIIGTPFIIEAHDEVIASKGHLDPSVTIPSWHTYTVEAKDWPGHEAFVYKGRFSYDDGFGDVHSHDFCYFWLPAWKIESKGLGWGGGGNFQGGCDVSAAIRTYFDFKKRVESGKFP